MLGFLVLLYWKYNFLFYSKIKYKLLEMLVGIFFIIIKFIGFGEIGYWENVF